MSNPRTISQKLKRRAATPERHTFPKGNWEGHSPELVASYIEAFWRVNYGRHEITYIVAGKEVIA